MPSPFTLFMALKLASPCIFTFLCIIPSFDDSIGIGIGIGVSEYGRSDVNGTAEKKRKSHRERQ